MFSSIPEFNGKSKCNLIRPSFRHDLPNIVVFNFLVGFMLFISVNLFYIIMKLGAHVFLITKHF